MAQTPRELAIKTRNRKLKFMRELKHDKACADCGISYPYYVMQYDHVWGDKVFSLSHCDRYSWEEIISEVEKCEIVCANCHHTRTWSRIQPEWSD